MEEKYIKIFIIVSILILSIIACKIEYDALNNIPEIDLNLTVEDHNISSNIIFDYNITIKNQLSDFKDDCLFHDQNALINSFAYYSIERNKGTNLKCGWVYNSVLNDLKNQDIKVYAVVIEDLKTSHIIPVVKLSNNIYYGYENQYNVLYTTIVRGDIKYNIYDNVEGYYNNDGSLQITTWHLIEKNAKVYIKLIEISDLYSYHDKDQLWLYENLIKDYALKYYENIDLCNIHGDD